jgi:hypothetical protein
MISLPNLIIIAGTGNKSGKTSMVCRIIKSYAQLKITAIKITPHFHETTEGLVPVAEEKGFAVYSETNLESTKDTSRMLHAGAEKVYFAKVWDDQLLNAFNKILENVCEGSPLICESPALRNYIEPGIFIIMTSESNYNKKNIKYLQSLPHLMIKLEELENMESLPVIFKDCKWGLKSEAGSPKSEAGI